MVALVAAVIGLAPKFSTSNLVDITPDGSMLSSGFLPYGIGGVVAAHVTKPVIGVPIDSSALNGLDALLSTVQMPPGVPVATVSIGKPGATNAGVLAAQILALGDTSIADRVEKYKRGLAEKVEEAARKLGGSPSS